MPKQSSHAFCPPDALGDGPIAAIYRNKYRDEDDTIADCLRLLDLGPAERQAIVLRATELIEKIRHSTRHTSVLDSFLHEYGLSNQEGIALMCLAEALLRVPDTPTRDALIADKIAPGRWFAHVGKAESLLVNASTLGLLLTGRIVTPDPEFIKNPEGWMSALIRRSGEPVIRTAILQAMRILGSEFVLGETIKKALERAKKEYGADTICSFDMLGEGARNIADAERYFASYENALKAIAKVGRGKNVHVRSGISVKLSALHPRYEYAHHRHILDELAARLRALCEFAADNNVALTVDAEEADRLELSLHLIERVCEPGTLSGWDGLGLAVQAYGKRALPVIDWAGQFAARTRRKMQVRLVKGAYWDTEIKTAQILGVGDFPVFTRKACTDVSYMACAREMIRRRDRLHCQFATHNAHTICAVMHMLNEELDGVEFQRLHGMGQLVYAEAEPYFEAFPPVRIYAPVGGHTDLLAYLVRRLLENGANSSFVNRFMDKLVPASEVAADPVSRADHLISSGHRPIPLPPDMFGSERKNARGYDLASPEALAVLTEALNRTHRHVCDSLLPSADGDKPECALVNPARHDDIVGTIRNTSNQSIDAAFAAASKAQPEWDARGGTARAELLRRAADMLEADGPAFIALLIREGGKTCADAVAELREAVDFYRYYACMAERHFSGPTMLPGPFGEDNSISLHGRGVFVCISPWNFPLAIFAGQIAAALAAGNAVICKPAEQTPIIAHRAVKLLHAAGLPSSLLGLAVGDGAVGEALIRHEEACGIAFTGGTATARRINSALAERPGSLLPLIAETGGQNVMFVDSTALLEQVCDDVIGSAFLSAGQRCSALRVLYLQKDIGDSALAMIRGAMDSLEIGDPSQFSTDVGPVIDAEAATRLEAHIADMKTHALGWHGLKLPAACAKGNFVAPHLFEIPHIGLLRSEHFGPILHAIRYRSADLEQVMSEAQSTGYGLTLGVHTRIERRWKHIHESMRVGNVYVNRDMVGAVVGSQPFGGQGLSGTGFKAGGPLYLYRFAVEKTLSVNTMASGGSTELLNQGPE